MSKGKSDHSAEIAAIMRRIREIDKELKALSKGKATMNKAKLGLNKQKSALSNSKNIYSGGKWLGQKKTKYDVKYQEASSALKSAIKTNSDNIKHVKTKIKQLEAEKEALEKRLASL